MFFFLFFFPCPSSSEDRHILPLLSGRKTVENNSRTGQPAHLTGLCGEGGAYILVEKKEKKVWVKNGRGHLASRQRRFGGKKMKKKRKMKGFLCKVFEMSNCDSEKKEREKDGTRKKVWKGKSREWWDFLKIILRSR